MVLLLATHSFFVLTPKLTMFTKHQFFPLFLRLVAALPAPAPPLSQAATKTYAISGDLRGPTSLRGYDPELPFATESANRGPVQLAPGQDKDDPEGRILDFQNITEPQPLRGTRGGTIASNHNIELEKLYPDAFAPPTTDHGSVKQAEWPLGLSHVKLGLDRAGWSRQQNINVLPVAKEMAGVNMRLEAGGYREMHCKSRHVILIKAIIDTDIL